MLVVIAIIGILVALLVPGVQAAREAGRRMQCANNLKQIAMAAVHCHESLGCLPPAFGKFMQTSAPSDADLVATGGSQDYCNTHFFWLLPFIEQRLVYDQGLVTTGVGAGFYSTKPGLTTAATNRIDAYICPSDSSLLATGLQAPPANTTATTTPGASYAANCQVFCLTGTDGAVLKWEFTRRIGTRQFRDGTSNTVLLAEKIGKCGLDWKLQPQGTIWARNNAAAGPMSLLAPYFSNSLYGPTYGFQTGVAGDVTQTCDCRLPSTFHAALTVAFADGSTRTVDAGVAAAVWWAALTPASGEVLAQGF